MSSPKALPRLPLVSSFSPLLEVAKTLNSASDRLSALIEDVEASLRKLRLGVSAWAQFDDSSDDNLNFENLYLGYTRHKGVWGLVVRTVKGNFNNPDDASEVFQPLAELNRGLRMRAIKALPALLAAMQQAANAAVEEITTSADQLEPYADILRRLASSEEEGAK